jgi:hypothetical protein
MARSRGRCEQRALLLRGIEEFRMWGMLNIGKLVVLMRCVRTVRYDAVGGRTHAVAQISSRPGEIWTSPASEMYLMFLRLPFGTPQRAAIF